MAPLGVELWTDKMQACSQGERATAQTVGGAAEGSCGLVKTLLAVSAAPPGAQP